MSFLPLKKRLFNRTGNIIADRRARRERGGRPNKKNDFKPSLRTPRSLRLAEL